MELVCPDQETVPELWPQDSWPLCVMDRSADIDQAEADLRRALFMIVGGARPMVTPSKSGWPFVDLQH
jgi:hypothetical protein